ncbi:MAG: hypothetical protein KDC73_06635 [Ignavibacteriae bacterium]|nr:hypothetical protein [Ignavibacteriota bacterium]MCB9243593.1 hypothetical protein [Ignavibacteriales bacterium]
MYSTSKLKKVCKNYLKARREFLDISNQQNELFGNDNIVGRIGEFIAIQFLRNYSRVPIKNLNKTQKGYDLLCNNKKISVKTITCENLTKRTTRIKDPWDELVLIELKEGKIEKIGYIVKGRFQKAIRDEFIRSEPYTKLSMLNPGGLIGRYGKVFTERKFLNKLL